MRGGAAWSDERVDLLKQLWADGKTAAVIAAGLGISRAAVLGKVFRLRLCPAAKPARAKPQKTAAPGDQRGASPPAIDAASGVPPTAFARDHAPARRRAGCSNRHRRRRRTASARGKTLFELTNDSCRWPFGDPGTSDFHFCGAKGADLEQGMPYCARHAKHAYCMDRGAAEKTNKAPRSRGGRRRRSTYALPGPAKRPALVAKSGRRKWRF